MKNLFEESCKYFKRFIILVAIYVLFSCQSAYYTHDLESTPYGVDYSKGKWLLNEIDAPYTIKDKLAKIAKEKFSKNIGSAFKYLGDDKSMALSYVPINPDTLLLKRLKKESQFDYLINIKGVNVKNEIGFIQDGYLDVYKKNVSETILQIYDLNTLEIIYNRKVIGKVTPFNEEDNDLHLVKSPNGMIVKSLNKILKKLNK
ncbi:MAG: hypothetical protein GW839_07775 [Flavobacteriales bacterium]|nr:hypothetical protein [Flavobacteriia bacterium]NCP07221.1 hypothetical protein [Flavobacteriales bacterium]PIV92864.1 MAG: hypothetical protein COW44_12500 [Flavobacteriaceae bacterium CG17_big_fil_post_rev_8_21_14_2_50_33_15]PIY09341.1 MAG: hypothetical protein COZ17_13405 [Flavobacteriaceae bacterium CG_4_10_14_3_um_filter_33_47]PJB20532.1 MAG: hypothetical protein CO117_00680 [Flavobacteriaceae bacterium CG_4_9_14_3_um_filter_33_16]